MSEKRPTRLTLLAFVVSTILAGNNSIAVHFSNVELPPFFGAAVRLALASLVLFLVVLILRLPLPKGKALIGVMTFGALQFGLNFALIYWSLLRVPAGLFQVVLSIAPLFTLTFAILHHQENFQWKVLIGGLLAIAGIAIIFRDQITAQIPLLSVVTILLAAACIAEAAVLFKTFPNSHPITTNALAMAVGSLILFIMSFFSRETPQWPHLPSTWIAIFYLVFLGSITTFILVLYVLSRWKASATSYQLVLMPIVTVLSASLITGESVTTVFLLGGILVLCGVYIGALMPSGFLERFRKNVVSKVD